MKPFKLLFAYDGSECAESALVDLTRAGLPEKTYVKVLSVVESWLPPPSALEIVESVDYRDEMLSLARRACNGINAVATNWVVEPLIGFGSPGGVIIEIADEWRPDLIVVGSHGRSAPGRIYFGSVSQKLVHEARCSVRVARGRVDEPGDVVRLVVGVDGSKGSEAAVAAVVGRNWPRGSEARIVTASWIVPFAASERTLPELSRWMNEENARIEEAVKSAEGQLQAAGLITSTAIKEKEPKQLLLEEAENWGADCIFVGARGMGRIERFLIGSVSSAVAARAHCSVEVVR